MGTRLSLHIDYLEHASLDALPEADRLLAETARAAAGRAYAPYSKFQVGAALRLSDGTVVSGNNQENASFPAGICAERTALHAAMSERPQAVVEVIAVMVPAAVGNRPVPPCGICRQALAEQEQRQGRPMRVLLATASGPVYELASANALLPLSFDASFLAS